MFRKEAISYLNGITGCALAASKVNHRVKTFAKLCGLTDDFNPPEKLCLFVRIVKKLYRLRRISNEQNSIASAVFTTSGISRFNAAILVQDLYSNDPIWMFDFLKPQCVGLEMNLDWPSTSVPIFLQKINGNSLPGIRSTRLINVDELIGDLLQTWSDRAITLYAELDEMLLNERFDANEQLQQRIAQDAVPKTVLPISELEAQFFTELLDEYWLGTIPWNSIISENAHRLRENRDPNILQTLITDYITKLPDASHPWQWENWEWKEEWDWNGLLLDSVHVSKDSGPVEHEINFAHHSVGDWAMKCIGQYLHGSLNTINRLTSLNLEGNNIGPRGCQNFLQALEIERIFLKELNLSNNKISKIGIAAVAKYIDLEGSQITSISIENNDLFESAMHPIYLSLRNSTKILFVNLSGNQISSGIADVVQYNKSIQTLFVSWNHLFGVALKSVGMALEGNRVLNTLHLQYNAIRDEEILVLAKSLILNSTLQVIDLSHNHISKAVEVELNALFRQGTSRNIILSGDPIEANSSKREM